MNDETQIVLWSAAPIAMAAFWSIPLALTVLLLTHGGGPLGYWINGALAVHHTIRVAWALR